MYWEHLILVHLGPLEPLVSTEEEGEWMPELVSMLYTPENSPDPACHPLQHYIHSKNTCILLTSSTTVSTNLIQQICLHTLLPSLTIYLMQPNSVPNFQ